MPRGTGARSPRSRDAIAAQPVGASRSSNRATSARQRAAIARSRVGSVTRRLDAGRDTERSSRSARPRPAIASTRPRASADGAGRRVGRARRPPGPPRAAGRSPRASRARDRAARRATSVNPSPTAARASLARPSATARSACGGEERRRGPRSRRAASSASPSLRERGRPPTRGRPRNVSSRPRWIWRRIPAVPDRAARQAEAKELVGLVPATERDGRLRRDGQDDARRMSARPRGSRTRSQPCARDLERLAPVRPTRSSRVARFDAPRAIPSGPPRSSAIARPARTVVDPVVDATEHGQIPAEDAEGRAPRRRATRPSARRRSPPRRTGPTPRVGRASMRSPARWARILARAADGGSVGISRSAASTAAAAAAWSPASQRYQRCRSWSDGRAARVHRSGRRAPIAPSPSDDGRAVLADEQRGLGGTDEDVHAIERGRCIGHGIPEVERIDVAAVRVQERVRALGCDPRFDRRASARRSSPAASQW